MNQWSARDLQLWLKGEFRTDGWMSDWQKDLIRRRKEEETKRTKEAA